MSCTLRELKVNPWDYINWDYSKLYEPPNLILETAQNR